MAAPLCSMFLVQSAMLQSQRQLPPRSSAHPCPEGLHLPPKPPSLGCCCGTRQGKGAEAQLAGPWQDPTLLQVWRAWLGIGAVGGLPTHTGCSPLPGLSPQAERSHCCAGGANVLINREGKKQVTDPPSLQLTSRSGTSVSSGCAVPVPQGRHTLHSYSCPTPLWAGVSALAWWQFICIESTAPPSFPSEAIVYLSPLALAWSKLQSKAAENNFWVWLL